MQVEKKNKLFLNFFSLGFVQVINLSLQLLVIPYVIKVIGADGFGVVAVAQVVMIFLGTITDFGFYQTATRKIAINGEDSGKNSIIFSRVIYSKLILCFIAFLLLLILLMVVPLFRSHSLLYLMAFVFVLGQSFLMNWFFQGLEKMWFIVLATLVGRILFVVLVFMFINNKEDGFLYLFFMGIGNIVAGMIGLLIAFRVYKLRLRVIRFADIRDELKDGWQYTITNLSMNTCQYANIFILRFFTNDLVVGYFSIAEKIFFAVKQGLTIFSQTVYPRICRLVESGKNNLYGFLKNVYIPFLLFLVAGSIILFILSPQVLYIFSGKEAVHSVFILRMLCIVLIIVSLNIPSSLILLATDQKKRYFKIFAVGGVLNVISNIILAYFFQSDGTIMAIFITEFFITTGVIYQSRKIFSPKKINLT